MRNWLFVGHPEAGDGAALCSLVASCQRYVSIRTITSPTGSPARPQ